MSLRFFDGPAGSGKTTRLFGALSETIESNPLGPEHVVLALTKMHGSRRRMHSRLVPMGGLRGQFECVTVDSFAWRVYRRWRSLARAKGIANLEDTDFAGVCMSVGALLSDPIVERWVTRRFPIVVIDEMQDSKGGQLEIVRGLSRSSMCIAAGDSFQDLDSTEENTAVAWAQQYGQVVSLSHNFRTSAAGLLSAACALREGRAVPLNANGLRVLGALNRNVGASFVSKNLTWWNARNDVAVISPVRIETSQFVQGLIARVQQGPIGTPPCGPYFIRWENSLEDECERLLSELGLPDDPLGEIEVRRLRFPTRNTISEPLRAWLDQRRRLTGLTSFSVKEIRLQVALIHQRRRAFRRVRESGLRAMTIHQAKNREFDSVIVLWPYEVGGSVDRQRRLLYNAITRAKRQALVVVQGPGRLERPPFVA